jgi:hypothetical protein
MRTKQRESNGQEERKVGTSRGVDRRSFVKLLPALGAAGLAASHLPLTTAAQTPTPTHYPRRHLLQHLCRASPKDMMHQTEQLIGIELTDAQETMALPNVNRSLDSYETLRKIDVPLDTEPAIAFHPARASKRCERSEGKISLQQS